MKTKTVSEAKLNSLFGEIVEMWINGNIAAHKAEIAKLTKANLIRFALYLSEFCPQYKLCISVNYPGEIVLSKV